MIKRICKLCGKEFLTWNAWIKRGRHKYCSIKCGYQSLKGRKRSMKTRMKMSIARKGIKLSNEHRKNISKNHANISGKNNPNWRGGRYKSFYGYILVWSPNHPFKNKTGSVFEHRLVMEKHLGRYLRKNEFIHHKNGIKDDNRLQNLQIVYKNPHYGKVKCPFCNKNFLLK